MKRGWIGALLLAALLTAGILSSRSLNQRFVPMQELLERSSAAAAEGDWAQTEALARKAGEQWESHWRSTAVFADHSPMEQVDGLFAQLQVYAQARQTLPYSAVCTRLIRELEAMGDAHAPVWWNLL